jgi:hypothetical protein
MAQHSASIWVLGFRRPNWQFGKSITPAGIGDAHRSAYCTERDAALDPGDVDGTW